MKKTVLGMAAMLYILMWSIPMTVSGQKAVNQLQFGKQEITVAPGEEILFYDHCGTEDIYSRNVNNAQSLTVFRPTDPGMVIELTFIECDVQNGNLSWQDYPGEVHVYDGDPDPSNSFVWPTAAAYVTDELPSGALIEVLDGEYTNKVYYSNAPDGSLSVGLIWHYAKRCKGWTARVRCLSPDPMILTGAGSDYSMVDDVPDKKTSVNIAGCYIDAEGIADADVLTGIRFRFVVNEDVISPDAVRLYKGAGPEVNGSVRLATTLSSDGDTHTLTLSDALQNGRNLFTLVADIPASAPVGGRLSVEVTGMMTASHPEGVTPFSVSAPVVITNPAIVLLSSTPQTITVGDTPLTLYDDGGKDGQVTPQFSGYVIFVPESPEKKVQIDFTKIALANGSFYYQYINVYNGQGIQRKNLLREELRHGETCLLRSTSDDGALTVELTTNGTSQTADGIEATVSQYQPTDMRLDHVAVEQQTQGTVCAGDTDQPILLIDVVTTNTDPALTADAFHLTSEGTYGNVTHATLYYTHHTKTFAKTEKVGEADVTSDDIIIGCPTPVTLSEGDNYFWLAYTISDEAANGTAVDAGISRLSLSGKDIMVSDGSAEGHRIVQNTIYCHEGQGMKTYTVSGSREFRTRDLTEYMHQYESGDDDRISTFKPKHPGMICEIDFSEFGLQYTEEMWGGVKSKFKIISGSSAYGKVLWELKSVEDKDAGPGHVIRSDAEDGSLTIVFNPMDHTYTSTGWVCTVSEYESMPMTVSEVEVRHQSTKDIPNGSKNQELLDIAITAKGDLSVISLNSITLQPKHSPISVMRLYYTGRVGANPAISPIATTQVKGSDNEVVLTLATPLQLQEGPNHFLLTVDVADEARSGDIIDAAVTSINAGGTDYPVVDGDPDGARTVRDVYLLQSGDNGEIGVSPDQHIMFFDDGGGDHPSSYPFDGTVTFYPKVAGTVVRFDIKELRLGSRDAIYIYEGAQADDGHLIATLTGVGGEPPYFVSGSADGKLTARFVVASTFTQPDGFAIEVTAYHQTAQQFTSLTSNPESSSTVLRGQSDIPLLRIAATVSGDLAKKTLERINLTTSGAALSHVRVYTTDQIAGYTPIQLFGESSDGGKSVSGRYPLEQDGTYYFYVAGDIATDAASGSEVSVSALSIVADGETYPITTSTPALLSVGDGFHGTLTVGSGADYGTIQAAVDAISGGIDGPVRIIIKPGIYQEKVNVPNIPGSSANNTLTIESETGSYQDVHIYYDRFDAPPYSDDQMRQYYGVFTIAGSDYVTLRGLDITTRDMHFPGVVHIKEESRHVTIDHCHIHTARSDSYEESDIKLINTYAVSEPNRGNDYLTVKDCLLEGGWFGIRMGGTGYVSQPKERGGTIVGNVWKDQGGKAIYVAEEAGVQILHNTIIAHHGLPDYRGMDLLLRDTYDASAVIDGNTIDLMTGMESAGICIRYANGTDEHPAYVMNNEVTVNSGYASSAGINLRTPSSHLYLAHNTVRMCGASTAGPALWAEDGMGEDVRLQNNILQNENGGFVYRFQRLSDVGTMSFSHNVEYTDGNTLAYIYQNELDIAGWLLQSGATGHYQEHVTFLSDEVLEPAEPGHLLTAEPLHYVTTDRTGTPRDIPPTIGAYEYDDDTSAPQMNEGYPVATAITDTSADLLLNADKNSTAYVLVRPVTAVKPDMTEVMGAERVTLHKNATGTYTATGLTTGATYMAYVALQSLRGTTSELYQSAPFVASGHELSELPVPVISVTGPDRVEQGDSFTLTAEISDGTAPYSITWLNGKHEVLREKADVNGDELTYRPSECDDYTVSVRDANGIESRARVRVIVTGDAVTATFENLYLDEESYWNGSDGSGSFVSGSYLFENTYASNWQYWENFGYSNRTQTTFTEMNPDQYNSVVGYGHDHSANYAVAYPQGGSIRVLNHADGDVLRGMYVTNEAWTADAITRGDGYTPGAFREGDYLLLTITGTHADESTSTKTFYLADYRSPDAADRYYIDSWQWVDLRSLGPVTSIQLSLSSSRWNEYGMTTPGYLCIDDFNGEREERDGGSVTISNELDLSTYFDFDINNGSIVYDFADTPSPEVLGALELTTDGILYIEGYDEPFDVVIQATQRGQTSYVRIHIDILSGITDIATDDDNDTEWYTLDGKRLSAPRPGLNISKHKNGRVEKIFR